MKLSKAVKTLTNALNNDPELYYGCQSNIATAFIDEYHRFPKKHKNKQDILQIANTAAKNFLDMWIK